MSYDVNDTIDFLGVEETVKNTEKALEAFDALEDGIRYFCSQHGERDEDVREELWKVYYEIKDGYKEKTLSIDEAPQKLMQGIADFINNNETFKSFGITASDAEEKKTNKRDAMSQGFEVQMNFADIQATATILSDYAEYAWEEFPYEIFKPIEDRLAEMFVEYTDKLMPEEEAQDWASETIYDTSADDIKAMLKSGVLTEELTNYLDNWKKEHALEKSEKKEKTSKDHTDD